MWFASKLGIFSWRFRARGSGQVRRHWIRRQYRPTVQTTFRSMSTDKCTDSGSASAHVSRGHDVVIAGVNSYSVGDSSTVVMIATDVFGYKFTKTREIADAYAAAGYRVLIPDVFRGDPISVDAVEQAKRSGADVRATVMAPWAAKHPIDDGTAIFKSVLDVVAHESSAVFINGFCYGGKVAITLMPQDNVTGAVMTHPSRLSKEDASFVTKPALFVCAELDNAFDATLRQYYEQTLKHRNDVTFRLHAGVEHGFAVRDDGSEVQVKEKQKAIEESIQFFRQYSAANKL